MTIEEKIEKIEAKVERRKELLKDIQQANFDYKTINECERFERLVVVLPSTDPHIRKDSFNIYLPLEFKEEILTLYCKKIKVILDEVKEIEAELTGTSGLKIIPELNKRLEKAFQEKGYAPCRAGMQRAQTVVNQLEAELTGSEE